MTSTASESWSTSMNSGSASLLTWVSRSSRLESLSCTGSGRTERSMKAQLRAICHENVSPRDVSAPSHQQGERSGDAESRSVDPPGQFDRPLDVPEGGC